jgi:hypothetical protein
MAYVRHEHERCDKRRCSRTVVLTADSVCIMNVRQNVRGHYPVPAWPETKQYSYHSHVILGSLSDSRDEPADMVAP